MKRLTLLAVFAAAAGLAQDRGTINGTITDTSSAPVPGATITVIPTLIIYLVLQRQFVAGLTLGSSKG